MPRSVTSRDATGSFASVAALTYAICANEGVWMCTSSRSESPSESESESASSQSSRSNVASFDPSRVSSASAFLSRSSGPPSASRSALRFASCVFASLISVASRAPTSTFCARRSARAIAAAFTSSKRSPKRKRAASASFSSKP